mmetsp:Transcript_103520/g.202952  ORF Transcript_103520/g.202952 Transcript_103520/m.202952 type:complete len:240 (-) Transcript_103520:977-1696(-)
MIVRQILGYIETDASCTHHSHTCTSLDTPCENVDVAHNLHLARAWPHRNIGIARGYPSGQHYRVILKQVCSSCILVQAHIHTGQLQLLAEVAQRLEELFLPRHNLRQVELSSDGSRTLKQSDFVSALGGSGGTGETSGASTHHSDVHLTTLRHWVQNQFSLICCERIHETTSFLIYKDVIQTCLVASNARINLIGTAFNGFLDEVRVSEQRARHTHHICRSSGDYILCYLWGVDAVGSA